MTTPNEPNKSKTIPLHIADQAVAACEAEIQKLREENARLKAEVERLTVCKSGADQLKAKVKRAAKSKPAAKTTHKTRGWRKMSTAPLGTPIEVRFAGVGADIRWRTVTATLDEHGFWIGKVYWARWTADGKDRLDDWRPLSK